MTDGEDAQSSARALRCLCRAEGPHLPLEVVGRRLRGCRLWEVRVTAPAVPRRGIWTFRTNEQPGGRQVARKGPPRPSAQRDKRVAHDEILPGVVEREAHSPRSPRRLRWKQVSTRSTTTIGWAAPERGRRPVHAKTRERRVATDHSMLMMGQLTMNPEAAKGEPSGAVTSPCSASPRMSPKSV